MLISVIVPIYNGEKYLIECLDSVINQSNSSYEILLVDDGSTDHSSLICREYEKKFHNIKLISEKHEGVSHARNIGLDNAQGEYVFFLDCDDVIHPKLFSIFHDYAIKNKINFAATSFYKFHGNASNYIHKEQNAEICIIDKTEVVEWFGDKRICYLSGIGGKLIKRDVIGAKRFNEECIRGEDTLFVQQFIGEVDMLFIKSPWYFYRMNPESAIHTINFESLECEYRVMSLIRDIEEKKNNDRNALYWEKLLIKNIQLRLAKLNDNQIREKQLLEQQLDFERYSKFGKDIIL